MVAPDGFPASWKRYCYGLAYLNRRLAKDRLAAFQAATAAQTIDQTERTKWVHEQIMAAGWRL